MTREVTGIKLPKLHEYTWARDLLCEEVCNRREASVIMCGMWSLWMMRNSRKHGQPVIPTVKAIQWVSDIASDLLSLLHPLKGVKVVTPKTWERPQQHWMKCNVDGSFLEADNTGSAAAILRDWNGGFQGAAAEWQEQGQSALMMEAMARRLGVQLARDRGITRLCLETDCLELVGLWKDLDSQRSSVSFVLHEIRSMCRGFDEFTFSFAPRTCNRVAHTCARLVSGEQTRVM